jgi:preprotein translocase SecE subunit
MNKILHYFKEVKNELKEVVFPTSSQTIIYTVIVIAISVAIALMLGGIDLVLREALAKFLAR